jgi:phosphoglycolate phosphatase-like HAD superfamily hydrolase
MAESTCHDPAMPVFLFDLDGPLIDSVYQHVLAWHEALQETGLSLAVWRIHRRIGMSGGLFVQALGREIGHPVTTELAAELQQKRPTCLSTSTKSVSGSEMEARTTQAFAPDNRDFLACQGRCACPTIDRLAFIYSLSRTST